MAIFRDLIFMALVAVTAFLIVSCYLRATAPRKEYIVTASVVIAIRG